MRTLLVVLVLAIANPAIADLVPDAEADVPGPDGLTGEAIYRRVLAHGLRSLDLSAWLVSGNGAGDERETFFRLRWKDDTDDPKMKKSGLRSVAIINPLRPTELRYAGYRIEQRADGSTQEFIYLSAFRRIFRFPLRGLNFYGSEFSFDDIVPREAENFRYRRLPDESYEGKPVFVIELYPREGVDAEHSRILVYVEKGRDVIRRARYFDAAGDEIRTLSLGSLERFGDSWIPKRWKMERLRTGGVSTLRIKTFEANPAFRDRAFLFGRLESH